LGKLTTRLFGKIKKETGDVIVPGLIHTQRHSLSESEAKQLILSKLSNEVFSELVRYLKKEQNNIFVIFLNLWEKYTTTLENILDQSNFTRTMLQQQLEKLNYYQGTK
jgi:hypothetical protein